VNPEHPEWLQQPGNREIARVGRRGEPAPPGLNPVSLLVPVRGRFRPISIEHGRNRVRGQVSESIMKPLIRSPLYFLARAGYRSVSQGDHGDRRRTRVHRAVTSTCREGVRLESCLDGGGILRLSFRNYGPCGRRAQERGRYPFELFILRDSGRSVSIPVHV